MDKYSSGLSSMTQIQVHCLQ